MCILFRYLIFHFYNIFIVVVGQYSPRILNNTGMTKAFTAKRESITVLNEKTMKLPLKYKKWPQTISASCRTDELQHCNDDDNEENLSYQKFLKDLPKKYKAEPLLTHQQFQSEFIDIIPSQWAVCSVTANIENNELYICHFCQKTPPSLLRLPLKWQSENAGFLYNDAIREFKEIMDLIKQSTKEPRTTKQQKLIWRKKRKELDDRMKVLLKKIEDHWLGGSKVIMCTYIYSFIRFAVSEKKEPLLNF